MPPNKNFHFYMFKVFIQKICGSLYSMHSSVEFLCLLYFKCKSVNLRSNFWGKKKRKFRFKHSTSEKIGFSKIAVPRCVDETVYGGWWINVICLRMLNFSLSSHVSYLHFCRCVDFTCLMDKKMEILKTAFSYLYFYKWLSSVRFRDL